MKVKNLSNVHTLKIQKICDLSVEGAFNFNNFVVSYYHADLSLLILYLNLLIFQIFYFCKKFCLEENKSFLIQEVETGIFLMFPMKIYN